MRLPLPPVAPLADRDVARLLHQSTAAIGVLLDAVGSDPLGIKGRTFRDRDETAGNSDAALVAKVIGSLDDSLVWAADATGLPGTAKWSEWTPAQRRDWWIGRVGAITTAGVAYPGVFGALLNRLPIQTVLGFGHQSILLCAVARAYGVDDRYRQTDLLARVLCRRTLDSRELLTGRATDPADKDDPLVKEMWAGLEKSRAVLGELERRPSSKQPWRMLSAVPLVGVVAGYIGETGALRRASDAVVREVD